MPHPRCAQSGWLLIPLFAMLLQLSGCASSGKPAQNDLTAAEYRQQAYHSVDRKRYADAENFLRRATKLAPRSEDYLLLGDLQEALQEYRVAQKSYQQGFAISASGPEKTTLLFHWATLAALELDDAEKAAQLARQLPAGSAAASNLQAALALANNRPDEALRLTAQVIEAATSEQEMKGWAHYHAARAWNTLGNQGSSFQALFFAINHARGHGLVNRITRLWEELKQQPRQQQDL